MKRCATGKIIFESEGMAKEELVQIHVKYKNSKVSDVYQCEQCGFFHLTSKGDLDKIWKDTETKHKINKQIEASYWEDKFNR